MKKPDSQQICQQKTLKNRSGRISMTDIENSTHTLRLNFHDMLVIMQGYELYTKVYGYTVLDMNAKDAKIALLKLQLKLADLSIKFQEDLGDEAEEETTAVLVNSRASIKLMIEALTGGKEDGTN